MCSALLLVLLTSLLLLLLQGGEAAPQVSQLPPSNELSILLNNPSRLAFSAWTHHIGQ